MFEPFPDLFSRKDSAHTFPPVSRTVCCFAFNTIHRIILDVNKSWGSLKYLKTSSKYLQKAALLDAIVLAVVSREKEGTYGYKITQDVRKVIDISDSTLYPVLRRLQKDQCLMVYDLECAGRNRRYYKVTEQGLAQLGLYKEEWKRYSSNISMVFEGGINNEL